MFDSELGLESAIKILDVNNTADTSKSGFASIDKRKSREVVMKVKVSKIVPGLILILVRIGVNSCE